MNFKGDGEFANSIVIGFASTQRMLSRLTITMAMCSTFIYVGGNRAAEENGGTEGGLDTSGPLWQLQTGRTQHTAFDLQVCV